MRPSIPSGTRDFSPADVAKRNYIFSVLKSTFERYGYQPIETPAMENLETLMGKYGEEGDKLIFKILNSGDYIDQSELLESIRRKDYLKSDEAIELDPITLTPQISQKALRYDLTVPFARYVVQHQHEITFPFKRYQMQPVWRADRPQKGRYREFYQCDVDVIGSNSLLNEVELIQIIDEVFKKLGVEKTIQINSRKILSGICEIAEIPIEKINEVFNAIDMFDKMASEDALNQLNKKGFSLQQIQRLKDFLIYPLMSDFTKTKEEHLSELFSFHKSSIGLEGIEEIVLIQKCIEKIYGKDLIEKTSIRQQASQTVSYPFHDSDTSKLNLHFDIGLARGLDYYTGIIIEVKPVAVTLSSSMCGGGRYDNLTGIFGLPDVSGVGVSFGIERIMDVMNELNRFDELKLSASSSKIMFVNFGPEEEKYCLPLVTAVRASGINAELYPDQVKVKKQFEYADKKKIPYVVVVGSEEMKSGNLTLKDMKTGEQKKMAIEEIIDLLKSR